MKPFNHTNAKTLVEAKTALAGGKATIIAGGTDLLVQIKTDVLDPPLVIDIKRIAEVRKITVDASGCWIGAAVTGAELPARPLPRAGPTPP